MRFAEEKERQRRRLSELDWRGPDGVEERGRAWLEFHAPISGAIAPPGQAYRGAILSSGAESLNARKVHRSFSTFLEHVKPLQTGRTRWSAFTRVVPLGRAAGREIERGARSDDSKSARTATGAKAGRSSATS